MSTPGHGNTQRIPTRAGTAWRTVMVMSAAVLAIATAAWLGSSLVGYGSRLAMVPAVPAAFAIGLLTVGCLRARNGFIAAPLLGTLLAALAGAFVLHGSVLADGHLYVSHSHRTRYEEVLLVTGTVVALVSIVCAALGGRRTPVARSQAINWRPTADPAIWRL